MWRRQLHQHARKITDQLQEAEMTYLGHQLMGPEGKWFGVKIPFEKFKNEVIALDVFPSAAATSSKRK
jgi:hypothetical protein